MCRSHLHDSSLTIQFTHILHCFSQSTVLYIHLIVWCFSPGKPSASRLPVVCQSLGSLHECRHYHCTHPEYKEPLMAQIYIHIHIQ